MLGFNGIAPKLVYSAGFASPSGRDSGVLGEEGGDGGS